MGPAPFVRHAFGRLGRSCAAGLAALACAALAQGVAGAPPGGVDADWRAWSQSVLARGYSDPLALEAAASRRYEAALQSGDLKGRIRAAVEQQVGIAIAGESGDAVAAARVEATLAAARASGRQDLLFDAIDARLWAVAAAARADLGEPLLAEQEALARALGDPARVAAALSNRAYAASMAGDLSESLKLHQQALAFAVDDLRRADTLLSMADSAEWALTDARSRQTRIDWAQSALVLMNAERYPYAGLHAYHIIAKHIERDDPAKAVQPRQRALELALRLRSPATIATMRVALATTLVALARSDEALAETARAMPALSSEDFIRTAYAVRALAYAQKSDRPQALAWLARAEKMALGPLAGWPRAREDLERLRAQVYAELGDWQQAYAATERGRVLADRSLRAVTARQAQLLEARYDAQLKAQENVLLRATSLALEERRLQLTLGLGLAAAALLGFSLLALALARQKRALQRLGGEVTERNRELQDVHASRTRLLAAACHDLRQPAHALGLLAGRAGKADAEADLASQLEGIRRCSNSLTDMLDTLMDMAQLEGNGYAPQFAPVSVDDLLREAHLHFAASAAAKGLLLDIEPCGLWVLSDRHLLRRIVFNLVSNAVRYTRAGRVTVTARAEGGERALLEVQDTGPGIPASRMDDVFAEAVRLDNNVEQGLGIGLPIVQRAAHLLGHPLHAQSEEGVGSCFAVELPLCAPGMASLPPPPLAAPAGHGLCLLVLDDDEESLAASVSMARQWGFTTLAARDARQALRLAEGSPQPPDLALTDLHLEGEEDGLQAVQALRRRWPGLPALLVTGDMEATVLARAAALGVLVGYKPLSPGRLLARIEEALAQPVQAQESSPASGPMPLR